MIVDRESIYDIRSAIDFKHWTLAFLMLTQIAGCLRQLKVILSVSWSPDSQSLL